MGLELAEEDKEACNNCETKANNIHAAPATKTDMLKAVRGVKLLRAMDQPNIGNSRQHLKIEGTGMRSEWM